MKILFTLLIIVLACFSVYLNAETINHSSLSKITLDKNNQDSVHKHPFSDTVAQNLIMAVNHRLNYDKPITLFGTEHQWSALEGDSKGTHLVRFSFSAQGFTKGKLTVNGAKKSSLFLNDLPIQGSNEFRLRLLNQDYQAFVLVSGLETWEDFSISWQDDISPEDADNERVSDTATRLSFNTANKPHRASMKQYYDSTTVGELHLSPDGKRLVWSKQKYSDLGGDQAERIYEIIDLDSQQTIYRWQGMQPTNITWSDDSKRLVFIHNQDLFQLELPSLQLSTLAKDISGIRGISWLSNKVLLLSWFEAEDKPHPFTKRLRALEDRWSYFRGTTQLHKFDLDSGLFQQITHNPLSSNLLDIDKDTQRALITRSPINYDQPPHGLSTLYSLDLTNGEEAIIGQYRTFSSAHFHKEGVIVVAGPSFHDERNALYKDAVVNRVKQSEFANDFDGQLYLLQVGGEIKALSTDFQPSISQIEVLSDDKLLLKTTDQDRQQLYVYDFKSSKYTKIKTEVEVVSGHSVSKQKRPHIVYHGSSATRPQSVHLRSLRSSSSTTLFDSVSTDYANIDFVDLKDWDYTTKDGQLIDGRVYYPSNFDQNTQYPAIIYYYGGTSPVSRSYTGRWPFSLWASMGYVVYVLQPSGTIGYGQEFSARHVNAWGIHTADEIIESTQAFLKAHPFVDAKRIGNMGASYGGFMTMYLATKTDLFAASISHAGISNLSSYWGHGWWGYAYSGFATRGKFPYNDSQFYIDQSPLYAAENVQTPLLLIHGDADTNVPVSESHQMYTALKLLGKDVELVEFQGDDHHINTRERRFRWWETILAYMDMKLKNQPEWWNDLYPPVE